jgi:hypothetical protein
MGESVSMARWFKFIIAIFLGLTLGLAYGWFVSPSSTAATSLNTLRIDYKADIVLMVAEAYQVEGNLELAIQRLSGISNTPPALQIEESIQFARKAGYTEPDINRMQTLLNAIDGIAPGQGISTQ